MQAVEAYCRNPEFSAAEAAEQQKVSAAGLVAHALASGEVDSIRAALRDKKLEKPIERALRGMQIQQRNVRGSEGERDGILHRFLALRRWSGCSPLLP